MQPFVPQPVFSAEEIASLQAKITAAVKEALDKHFGPLHSTQQATQATQQLNPPAPQVQQEQEQEQEQEQKPLYQATVEDAEDDAENTAETTMHGNSMATGSKSHDSKQTFRKWAPHTGFLTTFLATPLTFFFGSCLASSSAFYLASFSASQFGYIRCMEEMEASGEG